MMTVRQYIENRPTATYSKHFRVISKKNNRNYSRVWLEVEEEPIVEIKITEKYIFIFIND